MIRRKYANMRIYEDNIDFADVENTITYSLSAKNLENNLNKREEELCNKIADLEAKLAESEKKFIVANNLRKNSDEVLLNYKTKKYGLDKTIQELRKMKLNLPEKEWYYKGFENCERQMSSHIADLTLEVKELKQQLAEKEKEIEYQESMKILAVENQNKKAIEQLEQIINLFEPYENEEKDTILCANNGISFLEYIDNQINELKGNVE